MISKLNPKQNNELPEEGISVVGGDVGAVVGGGVGEDVGDIVGEEVGDGVLREGLE